MAIEESNIPEIAESLWTAESTRCPVDPISSRYALTLDDAYHVQQALIARRLARGERVVGRKVGLTSEAMQRQLGVDQPDFGVITDAMMIPAGTTIDASELIAARLEPEYAFRIDGTLPVAPTLDDVRSAIGGVAVAIEIIDSRIRDWRIGLVDTVADNASSARVVPGDWSPVTPELLDRIVDAEIALECDGDVVASGPGSAVLGDPVVALHWLATAIGRYGQSLDPGSIVLAGAVTASVSLRAGTTWRVLAPGFASATVTVDP